MFSFSAFVGAVKRLFDPPEAESDGLNTYAGMSKRLKETFVKTGSFASCQMPSRIDGSPPAVPDSPLKAVASPDAVGEASGGSPQVAARSLGRSVKECEPFFILRSNDGYNCWFHTGLLLLYDMGVLGFFIRYVNSDIIARASRVVVRFQLKKEAIAMLEGLLRLLPLLEREFIAGNPVPETRVQYLMELSILTVNWMQSLGVITPDDQYGCTLEYVSLFLNLVHSLFLDEFPVPRSSMSPLPMERDNLNPCRMQLGFQPFCVEPKDCVYCRKFFPYADVAHIDNVYSTEGPPITLNLDLKGCLVSYEVWLVFLYFIVI